MKKVAKPNKTIYCNLHKNQEKVVLKVFKKLLSKPKLKNISLKEYKKIKMDRTKNRI